MDAYDYLKFVTWLKDSKRQPVIFAFTAGEVRDAAYAVEQSGILSQLAAEASAVEAVQKLIAREGYEIELGAGYASLTKDYSASTVATATGETWKAALAALVQAEGKEAGK